MAYLCRNLQKQLYTIRFFDSLTEGMVFRIRLGWTKLYVILGNYLRKPGNLFQVADTQHSSRYDLVKMMQDAGAVRQDIDAEIIIADAKSQQIQQQEEV